MAILPRTLLPTGVPRQSLLRARYNTTPPAVSGAAALTLGSFTLSSAGTVTVNKDGPSSAIYVPQSSADFTALSVTVPDSLWLCQEASGNLSDSIGAVTLTANGSPLYQQTVTGWTRKGLGFNETANQRFSVGAGTYNPGTSSSAVLFYYRHSLSTTGVRYAWTLGSASGNSLYARINAAGTAAINCIGNVTSGTYNYQEDVVHPFLFVYNRTAGRVRIYTDQEQINGTYGSGVLDATKGLGAGSGTSVDGEILWACQWYGAGAEAVDAKTTLSALGWTLAY